MPRVFIPTLLAPLADGKESIELSGRTVSQLLDQLAVRYPELAWQLREGDLLSPTVSLVINGDLAPEACRPRLSWPVRSTSSRQLRVGS